MEAEKISTEKCCVVTCDLPLGETFWNNQYVANATGWDLGEVSPPLKAYIDQLTRKNMRILIPGCGNTHEADYLLQQGFTNITVIDIAPALVVQLKEKFASNQNIKIILDEDGDIKKNLMKYYEDLQTAKHNNDAEICKKILISIGDEINIYRDTLSKIIENCKIIIKDIEYLNS